MNKRNSIFTILIAGAAAFAAYKFLWKAKAAKTLNVKLRSIKLKPISEASVIIEIANPTPQDLVLDAVNADLSINNSAISTLNYFKKTTIPANGATSIELRIQLNPLDTAKFAADLLFNKASLNDVTVSGNVSAENLVFPFRITQNLKF